MFFYFRGDAIMVSYMEADYVMKFEVFDYYHDITKTHMICIKEPDMKPHGCSTLNPSTIRAHVIIMKFLETIHEYFKENKIRCRMDDVIDSMLNSPPGILRSPTINLTNFDYNYKSNRYMDIRFNLEDKLVCYKETLLILSITDNNVEPHAVYLDHKYRTLINPLSQKLTQKNDTQKYELDQEGKKIIDKAKLKEIYSFGLDRSDAWDTFLNEKKMERLHKDDDKFKYFITRNEVLDKIDTPSCGEDCSTLIQQYTAENDSVAIQRGSILLNEFINDDNLENDHVEISIYKVNSNFVNFTVIAMIVLSHINTIEKWAVCKFK